MPKYRVQITKQMIADVFIDARNESEACKDYQQCLDDESNPRRNEFLKNEVEWRDPEDWQQVYSVLIATEVCASCFAKLPFRNQEPCCDWLKAQRAKEKKERIAQLRRELKELET